MEFYLTTDNDLSNLKDMLRILDNEDDNLLRIYLKTAEIALQTAVDADGTKDFYLLDEVKELYKTACFAYAGTLYTYRIDVTDGSHYPVNETYNSIIGALRGLQMKFGSEKNV